VLAVSEHGAPGRRPNIHAHFVGHQRNNGSISSRLSRFGAWNDAAKRVREW